METIERVLLTYFANALWMTCLITVTAILVVKLIGRADPAYRHAIWVMALVCAVILPLVSLRSTLSNNSGYSVAARNSATTVSIPAGAIGSSPRSSFWLSMNYRQQLISFAPLLTNLLVFIYLGSILHRGISLCWAWFRANKILRTASPGSLPLRFELIANQCCRQSDIGYVRFARSHNLQSPVVFGAWRPALILPEWFLSDISDQEFASALCHELAHISRHDFLFNLFYEALFVPLSFHPAAFFIRAQIQRSRELACDELAADNLPTRAAYARSLLNIARTVAATSSTGSNCALGLFDANELDERIINLLQRTNREPKTSGRRRALFAFCVLATICLIASVFSVQVAHVRNAQKGPNRFAGTWEGRFKDKVFVTVSLSDKDDKLDGTVSRFSIKMNPSGGLTDASSTVGADEISGNVPDAALLRLNTKTKGTVRSSAGDSEQSIRFDMKLTGADQAELRISEAAPGMPTAEPWRLTRISAKR